MRAEACFPRRPMTENWRAGEAPPTVARPNGLPCGLADPGESRLRPADFASSPPAWPWRWKLITTCRRPRAAPTVQPNFARIAATVIGTRHASHSGARHARRKASTVDGRAVGTGRFPVPGAVNNHPAPRCQYTANDRPPSRGQSWIFGDIGVQGRVIPCNFRCLKENNGAG